MFQRVKSYPRPYQGRIGEATYLVRQADVFKLKIPLEDTIMNARDFVRTIRNGETVDTNPYSIRLGTYCFFKKNPEEPFGKSIVMCDEGKENILEIPDVATQVNGKLVKLREVAGRIGVVHSIRALKLEENGTQRVVRVAHPQITNIGTVEFAPHLWAEVNRYGLPDFRKVIGDSTKRPSFERESAGKVAIYGYTKRTFEEGKGDGWHGCAVKIKNQMDLGRGIAIGTSWEAKTAIVLVRREEYRTALME